MTTADYLAQLQQDREDLVDNLETKGITGLSGDETFTELVPEVLNIPAGADLNDYFKSSIGGSVNNIANMVEKIPSNITIEGTSLSWFFSSSAIETLPLMDTSNVTDMSFMCAYCSALTSIPLLNTSNVTNMQQIFYGCDALTTIPQLNTSKVTNMGAMFSGSMHSLTNESLNNILGMCAGATSYTGTKTLRYIFDNSLLNYYYPASTIEGLSNYQAFIDAGWTIGW